MINFNNNPFNKGFQDADFRDVNSGNSANSGNNGKSWNSGNSGNNGNADSSADKMPKRKKSPLGSLITLTVIVLLIAVLSCAYKNDYKCYTLVMKFGKVVDIKDQPGLYFKLPFVESTNQIYAGNRIYDIPTSDVITKDKKSMIADDYVIWVVTNPNTYYQTLGAVAARAEERIDAAVYNATKNTISSMTQDEIIASRGETLTKIITDASNSDIRQYGIEIITAEIKALDLPEDNKAAVYERMISERENIASSYTAKGNSEAQLIRNQTDKQTTVILAAADKKAEQLIAEGEAEYMRILSDAYNNEEKADFYNYLRSLDALKESLKGENKTIVLDKDSELAKILYGVK